MAYPVETYLRELRDIRSSGAAVKETSYYGPLATLLNEVGKTLKPRVRCIINIQNRGAGIPDGGLFTSDQFQRSAEGKPPPGTLPARGVIEVKSTGEDAWVVADGPQVSKYWGKYRQVLVTNYRDFVLVGQDASGQPVKLETYRLAESEPAFWAAASDPHAMAAAHGERLTEYLQRVLLHAAPLAAPEDLAWFLASYAREAKSRVEQAADADLPALAAVRAALEQALGLAFQGKKGDHFFRSTLVQTLFYGVFSAWVLWSKRVPRTDTQAQFDWRTAHWELRVPMIRALFEQLAMPSKLKPLQLEEVLDWTGTALNRVDRASFFEKFEESHAVQYFYEPFLQAYDPELRKELGVWYTPPEIVRYMVARVDTALREEMGIADGLADPRVYVLDPCCGTGAYCVEVLRQIAATLQAQGEDALLASRIKRAAKERVFGFEILPAPFVVSHLQIGLLLQNLGAPLADAKDERAAVYLTNALTGWEPPKGAKQHLIFPEMEAERDAAEKVKQQTPILVVLGNPPYNGFAGLAIAEERDLSNAYRTTKNAPAPQGQGLNDLYVRFFRMAERRIVEQTGRGIVCFISNYSWLDGLSFTGMRERYQEVFESIWIDNLHGDRMMAERAPDGQTSETIFAIRGTSPGIKVGTAIALMVANSTDDGESNCMASIHYRDLNQARAEDRRAALLESLLDPQLYERYHPLEPALALGLPFKPRNIEASYLSWPRLPELFMAMSPGVNTSRDQDIISIDQAPLKQRMASYFDARLSDQDVRSLAPSLMASSGRYDAAATRKHLLRRGLETGYFVRFCYRPFDTRHVYWHPETKLLDEKREDLFEEFRAGNLFMTSRQKAERQQEGTPFYITRNLPDRHLTRPGSACFPLTLNGAPAHQGALFADTASENGKPKANLSEKARSYLSALGVEDPDADERTAGLIWMHALAIGCSPAYLSENEGALRQDWPRIPLPDSLEALMASAELGRQVAALLDTETPVHGVTSGAIRPELRAIGAIARAGGGNLDPATEDLAITVGWGHAGAGGVTMPAKGRSVARDYTPEEKAALRSGTVEAVDNEAADPVLSALGEKTYDIYLNEVAYWRNVPAQVWGYTIGGYQVMKKWLSYRERTLLGRALTEEEITEVTQMARRIAALLLLEAALDANYTAVKASSLLRR